MGGIAYEFELDEKDEMDTLNKAITLANPPTYCTLCKNQDKGAFTLTTNKDKEGNIYVNVKCEKCGGKAKLGLYKAGGFFWHRDFEKYEPKQSTNKTADF